MRVDIIGGGIIGMSAAYHLTNAGVNVRVFEKDKSYNDASFGRSCGGLRSQFFTKENILMSRYSIDFIKSKTSISFWPNGYLMLFGEDQAKDCNQSFLLQKLMGASTKLYSPKKLKEAYEHFNVDDLHMGTYTDDSSEGWIDPYELHKWFKDAVVKSRIQFVYEDGIGRADADKIIIASGCWSGEVAKHYGIDIPVKGHKHTVYKITTEFDHFFNWPLVADLVTGVYWRPEQNGYIVGYDGNGEWDSSNLDPDLNSFEEVWGKLYHRAPKVFEAIKMQTAWAGYYDACTIDSNAIIDHVGDVYFATGFTGRGLMHSPAVGLSLTEMILGKPTTIQLDTYKLNRQPNEEKYVI